MTDKQIIIDGVDVAKCRCFTSEWDFNNCGHICKGTECKYKRLWYKKQLKRKEQECEELKETLTEIKNIAEKENTDTKVLYNRRTYQRMKQILQKISEVKNANI